MSRRICVIACCVPSHDSPIPRAIRDARRGNTWAACRGILIGCLDSDHRALGRVVASQAENKQKAEEAKIRKEAFKKKMASFHS